MNIYKLILFLKILRDEFDNETPKNETLELSIAVSGGQATIDTSYEVDKISQYVDFVNLMAYDVKKNNNKFLFI